MRARPHALATTHLQVTAALQRTASQAQNHFTAHTQPPPMQTHTTPASHDIVYKQAVGSSDAFLGMSGKDPSSACCEALVVRIRLPGATSAAGERRAGFDFFNTSGRQKGSTKVYVRNI